MKTHDSHDAKWSLLAVVADAFCVLAAVMLATWVRFDSGWIHAPLGRDAGVIPWIGKTLVSLFGAEDLYAKYMHAGAVAIVVNYITTRTLHLYSRPQRGTFGSKIPRIVRAILTDVLIFMVLIAIMKNTEEYSNLVAFLFAPCAILLTTLQRYLLFRLEIIAARKSIPTNTVLVIGTDAMAARLVHAFQRDARLRVRVAGILSTGTASVATDIDPASILGSESELESLIEKTKTVTQVIVSDSAEISHNRLTKIVTLCERHMIRFNMVPDMFRILTSGMEVETIDDVPLLGFSHWPLDSAWNRLWKRLEDVVGASFGLAISSPLILLFAILHKCESPGPIFYRQVRCGYGGKNFTIFKLRTMKVDAEAKSGPVFASPNDPRRTKIGAWMRAHNIDELPQFWNVIRGDMSLVGPRPERPIFVNQFKEEITRYMWRHACRPGITGWAQVNGLRGDTSIEERIRYDLYYLERWSLAFDFKILIRTIFAIRNAY